MTLISFHDLPLFIHPGQCLAGLDVGKRTIGVAVSDGSFSFAHPRCVIQRKQFNLDSKKLLDLLYKENVAAIIVGFPINMNGSEGPSAQSVRAFVSNLSKKTDLPFLFQDERLSTVSAQRTLIEMNISRNKQAQKIDSAAAAFILQTVLDRIRFSSFLEEQKDS